MQKTTNLFEGGQHGIETSHACHDYYVLYVFYVFQNFKYS